MQVSLGIHPGPSALEIAKRAESLGYHRVWLSDSPAIYEDIWVHLALIAQQTERIKLGTSVLVPGLRHPVVTANAIATIDRIAPDRLACAFGTGFTARHTMGQKVLTWKTTRTDIEHIQGLLRGEVVTIDGRACQLIHRPEMAQPKPVDVPILLSAFGPKGIAITKEIADGWMGATPPPEDFNWSVHMVNGTVLQPGETHLSDRVIDAAGPWEMLSTHSDWEANRERIATRRGGPEFLAKIEALRSEGERHLAVHSGHVTHLSEADMLIIAARGDDIKWHGWVDEAEGIRQRAEESAKAGTTELLYMPAGSDIIREIETFYEAVCSVAGV